MFKFAFHIKKMMRNVSFILLSCVHVCSVMCACVLSHVWLFATPWTVASQALLFMECSSQEYWGRLPYLSPGDLSNPGIESASFSSPALAGRFFTTVPPGNKFAKVICNICYLGFEIWNQWFSYFLYLTFIVWFLLSGIWFSIRR